MSPSSRRLVPSGALVLLCATAPALLAGPATAAAPAVGTAESGVALVTISAGGHVLEVGGVDLVSDTVAGDPTSSVVVTPVSVDGVPYGQQSFDTSMAPTSVAPVSTGSLPDVPGVFEAESPAVDASAQNGSDGPRSTAGAQSFGNLSVLGIPVSLGGSAEALTAVTGDSAVTTKTLEVTGVALPSIAAVLASLGLDLSAVPVDTLRSLVTELDLVVSTALQTAEDAVATAQGAVDTAQSTLDGLVADLATATSALALADATVASTYADLEAALLGSGYLVADYIALDPLLQQLIPAAFAALGLYNDALSAQTVATDALAAAQAAVDAAQVVLDDAVALLAAAVQDVVTAIQGVLDGVPMVELDSLQLATEAVTTSAEEGGQDASVTGGQISGLRVLGADVLDDVFGSSTVDVAQLTADTLGDVTAVIDGMTATLASVLSGVTGLTLTAPDVDVLGSEAVTGVADGFGEASNSAAALRITMPRITLPSDLALPGADALPAFDGIAAVNGVLQSVAGTVDLVTVTEQSRFRPAVVAAPTTPTVTPTVTPPGTLPNTGLPVGLGLLAVTMIAGGGVLVRRRLQAAAVPVEG